MAAPNENGTNTSTDAGTANASADPQALPQSPGMLSKISNTFQGIKMPWNKEDGVPQLPADPPAPNDSPNANANSDGQVSPSMFSATMSKVSNTFSNIQMPWTNKEQLAQPPAPNDPPPASGPNSPLPNDGNVITGAFSKMSNTISNIQMPWNNKTDQVKPDASAPPADTSSDTTNAPPTPNNANNPEGNVLSNTFSKVTNTFTSMQMPWTSKSAESGSAQTSPPPDATAPTNGPASETSPLNKVTGFFTSVFRQGSTTQANDANAAAAAVATVSPAAGDANAENSPKTE